MASVSPTTPPKSGPDEGPSKVSTSSGKDSGGRTYTLRTGDHSKVCSRDDTMEFIKKNALNPQESQVKIEQLETHGTTTVGKTEILRTPKGVSVHERTKSMSGTEGMAWPKEPPLKDKLLKPRDQLRKSVDDTEGMAWPKEPPVKDKLLKPRDQLRKSVNDTKGMQWPKE